jgi:hypothetical protein
MGKRVDTEALKSIMSDSEMKENTVKKAVAPRRKKRLGNVNITLALNTVHYNQLMDYLEKQGMGATPYLRSLLYKENVISDDFDE